MQNKTKTKPIKMASSKAGANAKTSGMHNSSMRGSTSSKAGMCKACSGRNTTKMC